MNCLDGDRSLGLSDRYRRDTTEGDDTKVRCECRVGLFFEGPAIKSDGED